MWTQPVTDRTWEDVERQSAEAFRGRAALNRVEANTLHLAGPAGAAVQTRSWLPEDFPAGGEVRRILDNIDRVRAAMRGQITATWDYWARCALDWRTWDSLGRTWDELADFNMVDMVEATPPPPWLDIDAMNAAERILAALYTLQGGQP